MENHFSKFSTKSLTESWALIQPAQNLTVRMRRRRGRRWTRRWRRWRRKEVQCWWQVARGCPAQRAHRETRESLGTVYTLSHLLPPPHTTSHQLSLWTLQSANHWGLVVSSSVVGTGEGDLQSARDTQIKNVPVRQYGVEEGNGWWPTVLSIAWDSSDSTCNEKQQD